VVATGAGRLGTDHYFFGGGGGIKNPEKNCLQNQKKKTNKLFADMNRRKKVCRLVDT